MRLNKLNLDDIEHHLSNIVLILGPNGTGKTTLLQDLHTQAVKNTKYKQEAQFVKKWSNPSFKDDFFKMTRHEVSKWLEDHEEIEGQTVNNQPVFISRSSVLQQNGYTLQQDQLAQIKELVEDLSYDLENDGTYAEKIKGSRIGHLSVDTRLKISQEASFGYGENKLSSMLYKNKSLLEKVNKYIHRYFNKKIFVYYVSHSQFQLIMGDASVKEPLIYRNDSSGIAKTLKAHKEWRASNDSLQDITNDGHGIRAFLEVIISLVDPAQHVLFIDEPELHLYPGVKRRLGRDIALFAKDKQMILVTHDTDIIDGIIGAEKPFDVLRITKDHNVDFINFGTTKIKAIQSERKTPEALKVGFYDCAIFVEGVSDRYVYAQALNKKHLLDDVSFAIIPCNGKDRVANHIKFALEIKMPFAIIFDYDALYDQGKKESAVKSVLTLLKKHGERRTVEQIDSLLQLVDEVAGSTKGILDKTLGLSGDLARYSPGTLASISTLLEQLAEMGVFIVPNGALASWVGAKEGDLSPEQISSKYVSRSNSKYVGLSDFISNISGFLHSKT